MGRPKLTAEEQEEFSARIVAIAEELFFSEGYESVSMRKIAKEAGCSPMKIYSYFDSKRALLGKIWETIFEEVYDVCARAAEDANTETERLHSVCRVFVRFWLEKPEYFDVVYLNSAPTAKSLGHNIFHGEGSNVKKIYDLIEDILEHGIDKGEFRGAGSQQMLQVLFSSMFGMLLCLNNIPEYEWLSAEAFMAEVWMTFSRAYCI